MKREVVISLCDKTGNMVKPWAEAGFICICIDTQHSIRSKKCIKFEGGGEIWFVWGDARSWKPSQFDIDFNKRYKICFVSCFPVCTNLAGSGARDWNLKGIPMLMDGLTLFNSCEQVADWSGAPYCIENPVGCIPTHHRQADFYFHPWYYGEDYQKYTCLWVGNGFKMPERKVLTKNENIKQKIWLMPPGKERQDKRSETPESFARSVFEANYKM